MIEENTNAGGVFTYTQDTEVIGQDLIAINNSVKHLHLFATIGKVPKKDYEVESQYLERLKVYQNVLKDTGDEKKAICYSNAYFSIKFLRSVYSPEVTENVMRYKPTPYQKII